MNPLRLLKSLIFICSLLLQLAAPGFRAQAAPGDVDLSFDPGSGINERVYAVVVQPDGKVLIGGWFTMVKGLVRYNIARLNADGSGDAAFNADDPNSGISSVGALALQPDGKVLVGFEHGIARLNADGSKDTTFITPSILDRNLGSAGAGPIALQPDGKILIGGIFDIVNGVLRERIARLHADGSLDDTFDPGAGLQGDFATVNSIALQPDGRVLIGGSFIGYDRTFRNNIARVNSNGTLDVTFDPGTGINGSVSAIVLQPDGKLMVGGTFNEVNGTSRKSIARLNADGTLDSSFDPGSGLDGGSANALAVQSDGRVLVGGYFLSVNGTPRNRVARLNTDGTLDTTFNRSAPSAVDVFALAAQPDGKVLIGGANIIFSGTSYNLLTRVNADGSRDPSFVAGGGLEGAVYRIALQPDGKIMIGGQFRFVAGAAAPGIARLQEDGALDRSFHLDPEADGTFAAVMLLPDGRMLVGGGPSYTIDDTSTGHGGIACLHADGSLDRSFDAGTGLDGGTAFAMVVQPDGKALVSGSFDTVNGVERKNVARLNADGSVDATFNLNLSSADPIAALAVQADGKVLVGGPVLFAGDEKRYALVRVNPDGSRDANFAFGMVGTVGSAVIQGDGKVLIGGRFSPDENDLYPRVIARLNTDGSVDSSFHPLRYFDQGAPTPGVMSAVSIAEQADGKVLVGGDYCVVYDDGGGDSQFFQGVYRLNADGSLDRTFDPGAAPNRPVYTIALQPDRHVLVGGGFLTFDNVARPYLARLSGDSASPSSFALWMAGFGLSGADALADADPDEDGLPNAAEYIFGGNPALPTPTSRPEIRVIGDAVTLTFPRVDLSETSDVTLTVETSTDLVTWPAVFAIGPDTSASGSGVNIAENGAAPDTITVTIQRGTATRIFARLKVTITPL